LPSAAPEPGPGESGLVGRQEQLDRVDELLAGLAAGQGGMLVLTGEAGIGKTSLARAAGDRAAARGVTTAWGRCVEGAVAPAYWPWTQALRDAGPAGIAAAQLLDGTPDDPADPEGAQFRLYERVTAELAAAPPAVLVLDDLHWSDAASLRLLEFVAGRLATVPVLLVVTVRAEAGERGDALRETLARLAREPFAERLAVPAFSIADVGTYLAGRDLDPADAVALHERTGGNPFYLSEVCRLGSGGDVPDGIRDVIDRRVTRLPDSTRAMLRTAAAAGREVPLEVLALASGTDAERVMQVLEPAVAAGLLTEEDNWDYRFAHALVRDAVYVGLSRLERARLHLRVGEGLEAIGAATTPEGVARLAHHFGQSARIGGAAQAVRYATAAAAHATAQHAHDRAVDFLNLALDAAGSSPGARYPLLIELGAAQRRTGDTAGAKISLDAAVTAATEAGDTAAVVRATIVFGGITLWNWRPYGVVEQTVVDRLEQLLAGELPDADRALLLGTLALELYYGPRRADRERFAAEAVAIARRIGETDLLAQTLNNQWIALWTPDDEDARRKIADELIALPGLSRSTELVARQHRMSCLLRTGEMDAYYADLARCRELLQVVRRPELEGVYLITEATRACIEGRWDDVADLAHRNRAAHHRTSLWGPDLCGLMALWFARWHQGRGDEVVEELVATASTDDYTVLRPTAVLAVAEAGDEDRARRLLAQWGSPVNYDWTWDFVTPQWAMVAARIGAPDPERLYEAYRPYADRIVTGGTGTGCWGSGRHIMAELAASLGRRDEAREHARRAIAANRRIGATEMAERSEKLLAELSGD
jgi:hypothetical protein